MQPKAVDAEAEGTDGSEGSDGMLEAATPTAATMTEVFPEALLRASNIDIHHLNSRNISRLFVSNLIVSE